jgi:hypothetical protein
VIEKAANPRCSAGVGCVADTTCDLSVKHIKCALCNLRNQFRLLRGDVDGLIKRLGVGLDTGLERVGSNSKVHPKRATYAMLKPSRSGRAQTTHKILVGAQGPKLLGLANGVINRGKGSVVSQVRRSFRPNIKPTPKWVMKTRVGTQSSSSKSSGTGTGPTSASLSFA